VSVLVLDRINMRTTAGVAEFISTFFRRNRYQLSILLPRLRIADLS
jgi:hypothetical protein